MEGYTRCICKRSKKNETSQVWIGSSKFVIFILQKVAISTANHKKKNSTESNFETADVDGNENLESSTENPIEEDSFKVPKKVILKVLFSNGKK